MFRSLANEDVSLAEIAELVEKDTVLAGNVLRLVNSAYYGRRGTINSLVFAVSLIGIVKLRKLVMTLSISRMWSQAKIPQGWSAAQFNLHAVATAIMVDLLAQRVPVQYPEGAFVAGLLHDLGLLLVAIALPQEYRELRSLQQQEDVTLEEAEREVLGFEHSGLSAAAAAEWGLAEPIQQAVRYRYEPQSPSTEDQPLSRLVRAAEQIVDAQGIGVQDEGQAASEASESVFEQVGLAEEAHQILHEFETELESTRRILWSGSGV
jgi:HD-like signal output (HDOD) protein